MSLKRHGPNKVVTRGACISGHHRFSGSTPDLGVEDDGGRKAVQVRASTVGAFGILEHREPPAVLADEVPARPGPVGVVDTYQVSAMKRGGEALEFRGLSAAGAKLISAGSPRRLSRVVRGGCRTVGGSGGAGLALSPRARGEELESDHGEDDRNRHRGAQGAPHGARLALGRRDAAYGSEQATRHRRHRGLLRRPASSPRAGALRRRDVEHLHRQWDILQRPSGAHLLATVHLRLRGVHDHDLIGRELPQDILEREPGIRSPTDPPVTRRLDPISERSRCKSVSAAAIASRSSFASRLTEPVRAGTTTNISLLGSAAC